MSDITFHNHRHASLLSTGFRFPKTTLHLVVQVFAILSVVCSTQPSDNFTQWTCDDLTPHLCPTLEVSEGTVHVRGLNVHYWRYQSDAVSHRLPVVVIHGGPAFPHTYLLPLRQLACRGHPVYFYDQAGCGQSALPLGADLSDFPWLFDPAYYSQIELPALIDAWRLRRFHLVGHSWGTIVAQLFALDASPHGLASLVLAGPISDVQLYIRAQWDPLEGSLGRLPPFVRNGIATLQRRQAFTSSEYQAITKVLTTFFTCRTAPAPDCVSQAFDSLNADIYVGMQGPSEFSVGGVLMDFNVTSRLNEIVVPVLLTAGKHDTIRPVVLDAMQHEISDVSRIEFPFSGHLSMIDEPAAMNEALSSFMIQVETGTGIVTSRKIEPMPSAPLEPPDNRALLLAVSHIFSALIGFSLALVILKRTKYSTIRTSRYT